MSAVQEYYRRLHNALHSGHRANVRSLLHRQICESRRSHNSVAPLTSPSPCWLLAGVAGLRCVSLQLRQGWSLHEHHRAAAAAATALLCRRRRRHKSSGTDASQRAPQLSLTTSADILPFTIRLRFFRGGGLDRPRGKEFFSLLVSFPSPHPVFFHFPLVSFSPFLPGVYSFKPAIVSLWERRMHTTIPHRVEAFLVIWWLIFQRFL